MPHIQLVIGLLVLSCVSSAVAAESRCEITRFNLRRELIHPLYADKCVCAAQLSAVKAPIVGGMRLAAACAVRRSGERHTGAFYYVGQATVSGILIQKLLDPTFPADTGNDSLVFHVHAKPGSGWPEEIDLSPGFEWPELGTPEPTPITPCWQADVSMEIRVLRNQVDVEIPGIGTWSGFIPLEKTVRNAAKYKRCE